MRTLHKLFNDKVIKTYLMVFIIGVLSIAVLSKLPRKNVVDGFFGGAIMIIALISAGLGPIIVFFISNNFPKNIRWLINKNYNRRELFIFLLLSQSFRLIMTVISYAGLFCFYLFVSGESKGIDLSIDVNYATDIIEMYVVLLGLVYFLYVVPLFPANNKEVFQKQIRKSTEQSFISKANSFLFGGGIAGIVIIQVETSYVPRVLLILTISIILLSTMFWIINRTFRLFPDKTSIRRNIYFSAIGIAPILLISLVIAINIKNMKISSEEKFVSVRMLGNLVSYTDKEVDDLVKSSVKSSYLQKYLELFGDQISVEKVLLHTNSENKAKVVIDHYSKELSAENLIKIISFMAEFKNVNNLDFEFDSYSHSLFRKQKPEISYISELVVSDNTYNQLAAIYFARKTMDTNEFLLFVEKYRETLDKKIFENKYIKRTLESINKKQQR